MEKITTCLRGKITSEYICEIRETLNEIISQGKQIQICCKGIVKTDLAGFNALVVAYMKAIRANKNLSYINCEESKLIDFVSQTQLDNVFAS